MYVKLHYRTYKNLVLSAPFREVIPPPCHTPKGSKHFDYGLQLKIAIKRVFALFFTKIVVEGA